MLPHPRFTPDLCAAEPEPTTGFKVIIAGVETIKDTLAEAIAAAVDGDTIQVKETLDTAVGFKVAQGKFATLGLTIDFGGTTYTVSKPGAGSTGTEKAAFQFLKNNTITLKNGRIVADEANLVAAVAPDKNIYRFIQNYADLTIEDMTFDATNLYIDPNHAADYYPSAIEICFGTVEITGATSINDKTGMASLSVDTYKTYYPTGADVTVDTTGSIASILCYSEGTTEATVEPSTLDLEAGTIGSIAMAGDKEVSVSKAEGVIVAAPEGYEWKNGQLVVKTKFSGGDGTEGNPYQIANTNDLIELKADVEGGTLYAGVYFAQQNDIDMTGLLWTGIGLNALDSGTGSQSFKGIYDGCNYALNNLKFDPTTDYVGLFRSLNGNDGANGFTGCAVKNLTLNLTSDCTIKAGGAVAGFICGALIESVTVNGALTCNGGNQGGFCGRLYGNNIFTNCVNNAAISNTTKKVGGFAGHIQNIGSTEHGGCGPTNFDGTWFVDCVNAGDVKAGGAGTAGFGGEHNGGSKPVVFERCSNTGIIGDGSGNGGQFIGKGGSYLGKGGNTCYADRLASAQNAYDGLSFATVNAGVATLISTNDFVKGNTYKVMANGVAGEVFALAAADDTIAFDLSLVNDAYNFTVGAAVGLKVEASEVKDHVVTFTAVKDGPIDWPTDPEDPLVKGKTAAEAFEGKVPTDLANVPAANFAAWAKKAGIDFATCKPAGVSIDAYLLDCKPSEVEDAKKAFVITKIENVEGVWVVTVANEFVDEEPYNANATVEIVDITDEFDEALTEKTDAKGFFKAELKAIELTK